MARNPFQLPRIKPLVKLPRLASPVAPPHEDTPYTRRPTGIWKAFDLLNRPQYMVSNIARRATDPSRSYGINDYVSGAVKGFTGEERSIGSDILKNLGWKGDKLGTKVGRGIVGFGLDIALDPLTYVGGIGALTKSGKASKAGKLIKTGGKTLDITKDIGRIAGYADDIADAGKAGRYLKAIASKGGKAGINRREGIVRALRSMGLKADPVDLADTLAKRYSSGQAGITFMGKRLADMPGVGSVVRPVEGALYNRLGTANKALKAADARYFEKARYAPELITPGERLARGVSMTKRAFGFFPQQMEKLRWGSHGRAALHTAQIDDALKKVNLSKPFLQRMAQEGPEKQGKIVALIELLTSPDVLPKMPKGWRETGASLDDIGRAIQTSSLSIPRKQFATGVLRSMSDTPDDAWRLMARQQILGEGAQRAGTVRAGAATGRRKGERIGYVRHELNPEERIRRAREGADIAGSELPLRRTLEQDFNPASIPEMPNETRARMRHRFQTVEEAAHGRIDPDVERMLASDPERVFVLEGKKVKAKDLMESMRNPVEFDTDLQRIWGKEAAGQARHIVKTSYVDGLANFGRPLAVAGESGKTVAKVEPGFARMTELYTHEQLKSLSKYNPELYKKVVNIQIPHEYYEVARHTLMAVSDPTEMTGLIKKIGDSIKGWMLVSPGFHSRNLISNTIMNAYAAGMGVDGAVKYSSVAGKLQTGVVKKMMVNGREYTREQLIELAQRYGVIGSGTRTGQYLRAGEGATGKIGKAWMAIPHGNRRIGETIENNARLAHFLWRLEDGWRPSEAAASVMKTLYDYSNISDTRFQRRLTAYLPFYSWLRLNTAANVEQLLTNPQYISKPYKIAREVEAQTNPQGSPMDWIKERGAVGLGDNKWAAFEGFFPQLDITKVPRPMKAIEEGLHPIFKLPYEIGENKSLFTDREIAPPGSETKTLFGVKGVPKKLTHALSPLRPINELDRLLQVGGQDYRRAYGGYSDAPQGAELVRYLTGMKSYRMPQGAVAFENAKKTNDEISNLRYLLKRQKEYGRDPERVAEIEERIEGLKALRQRYQELQNKKPKNAFESMRKRLGVPDTTFYLQE
jgi:hypothetical protein